MALPQDNFILLSVINTKLRDYYSSLDALCNDMDESESDIIEKLKSVGYEYNENSNQFLQI